MFCVIIWSFLALIFGIPLLCSTQFLFIMIAEVVHTCFSNSSIPTLLLCTMKELFSTLLGYSSATMFMDNYSYIFVYYETLSPAREEIFRYQLRH